MDHTHGLGWHTILFLWGLLFLLLLLCGCTLLQEWLAPGTPGFTPITDTEAQAMLDVLEAGGRRVDDLMVREDLTGLDGVASWLRTQPGVSSCEIEQDGTLWVEFECGLPGSILPHTLAATPDAGAVATEIADPLQAQFHGRRALSSSDPKGTANDKAAVLLPFLLEGVRETADTVKRLLNDMGFPNPRIDEYGEEAVSLDVVRGLDEYSVVYVETHGLSAKTRQWIVLGEKPHRGGLADLWNWYKSKSVIGIAWCEGSLRYQISDLFVDVEGLRFPGSLILMNACTSRQKALFSNAFLSAGASVFFGWTNTTDGNLIHYAMQGLLEQLAMPHKSIAAAYTSPALQFDWDRKCSIDELFPATPLENSDGDGFVRYDFANGRSWGDPGDVGAPAKYTTDFVYDGDSHLVVSRLVWPIFYSFETEAASCGALARAA